MIFFGYNALLLMRQEVIIAIVLGFSLGLLLTLGVWTANRALKERQAGVVTPTPEIAIQPEITPPAFFLKITSPEDESFFNEAKITLAGQTQAGATVVIIAEKGEEIIEAAEDGSFSTQVSLVGGTNEITVTAFGLGGEEESQNLNLVYSTAEI